MARCLGIEVTPVVTKPSTSSFELAAKMESMPFSLQRKRFNFIWVYVLSDTETTSVSLFYNIESYFVTFHRSDEYFYHILQL